MTATWTAKVFCIIPLMSVGVCRLAARARCFVFNTARFLRGTLYRAHTIHTPGGAPLVPADITCMSQTRRHKHTLSVTVFRNNASGLRSPESSTVPSQHIFAIRAERIYHLRAARDSFSRSNGANIHPSSSCSFTGVRGKQEAVCFHSTGFHWSHCSP